MMRLRRLICGFAAMVAGAGVLAGSGTAQEVAKGWMPAEMRLPDDAEVLIDRALGDSYRVFSFRTGSDVDRLLTRWRRALKMGGYRIGPVASAGGDREFDFSGLNIEEAEVAVMPADEWRLGVIEIEARLRP